MRRRRAAVAGVLLGLLTGAAASSGHGGSTGSGQGPSPSPEPEIYEFGEVVVTADAPRVVEEVTTVDVVTRDEIERSGARTLDEAIALLPGLQLRRGAEGLVLLDVRGLRSRNVQVLLDGVPLGSSFDGLFDLETLALDAVARIELTRGASSVLYGPTGNAGVVDVVTRAASGAAETSLVVEGGTAESYRVAGRSSWRRGDLGVVAAGSFAGSDGFDLSDDFEATALEDGDRRTASDRDDYSALLSLTSTPEDGPRWGVTVGVRGGERGKPPATEDFRTSDFAPRTRFEREEADSVSLHAGLAADLGPSLSVRPTLFVNRTETLTDGFDDAGFDTQAGAGAFREDATSSVVGGGVQLALERPAGGLWTLAIDLRREE
ncbi:MAG: TonB-dependent receptor plug domain-containing protein, partial [Acidobacteriota bacterium]